MECANQKLKNKSRREKIYFFFFVFYFLFSALCFAQTISSMELIKNAGQYDGKPVTYSGEAIGNVMPRGEFAWVNISDGDNAIGAWLSPGMAQGINFTGAYKTRGDILEVTGVFHRSCFEHGADLDIHAQILKKVSDGRKREEKADFLKVKLTFILFTAIFLIWILTLYKRK